MWGAYAPPVDRTGQIPLDPRAAVAALAYVHCVTLANEGGDLGTA